MTASQPPNAGARPLALPRSGLPISFEQIEERRAKAVSGSSAVDFVIHARTVRDSDGRRRVESESQHGASGSRSSQILITDPTNNTIVILLEDTKTALRMPSLDSSQSKVFSTDSPLDPGEPQFEWKVTEEDLGRRAVEGIEFTGRRFNYVAQEDRGVVKTSEFWYSDALALTGFITVSGLNHVYSVRIQNLSQAEPHPGLFRIPPDFEIMDIALRGARL